MKYLFFIFPLLFVCASVSHAEDTARQLAIRVATTRPAGDPLKLAVDDWISGKQPVSHLGTPRDAAIVPALRILLTEVDGAEWYATRITLAHLGDPYAFELIVYDLDAEDLILVERSVMELMVIRRQECIPPLLKLLDDRRRGGYAFSEPGWRRLVSAPAELAVAALRSLVKNPPNEPGDRKALEVWREWKKTTDPSVIEVINSR